MLEKGVENSQCTTGDGETIPQIFNVLSERVLGSSTTSDTERSCTNSPSRQALVLFLSELRPEPGITKTKIVLQYVRCHRIRLIRKEKSPSVYMYL